MRDKKKNVALFIDNDNIRFNARDGRIDLNIIIDRIQQDGGIIVVGKNYITLRKDDDLGRKDGLFYENFKRGIEPVFTPIFNGRDVTKDSKSLGDPMLFCDAMEVLYEKIEVDMFVIVSGDKDMIPLIRHIAKRGKEVLVIGVNEVTADALITECGRLGYTFEDYNALINQIKNVSNA